MSDPKKSIGAHNSDNWGIPFSIKDADKARYAVKLSGLPVFLLGLTYALIGLTGQIDIKPDAVDNIPAGIRDWLIGQNISPLEALKWFFRTYFVLGLLLVWWGLKIRKGSISLVPIAALFYLVWTAITVFYSVHWIQWVMPIPWIVLSIGGLRGWMWLRKNQKT